MEHKGKLTNAAHRSMDGMLAELLKAVKTGAISERAAASGLAHIIAAVDKDNYPEALAWFSQQKLAFFKEVHDGLAPLEK